MSFLFLFLHFLVQSTAVTSTSVRVTVPPRSPFIKANSLPPLKGQQPQIGHSIPIPIPIPTLPDNDILESNSTSPANSISALIAAPTSADAFRRAHRHSIPGHRLNNYLKFLHELAAKGSSIAYVFSTAVISGYTSDANIQQSMCHLGENIGKINPTVLVF